MRLERLRNGDDVLAFMADALVYGPGEWEGQPWRPLDWQADFIRALYATDAQGHRVIDRALLLCPKGAGKTELLGALAVVEMLIRDSADVIIAAASWAQASLLKGAADGCCSHPNSALANMVEVTESEIRLRGTTSRILRVASDAGANDGARPTCLVRDETHEWNTPSRIRNYQVLGAGLAKRSGCAIDISTVGADKDSLLGRLVEYAEEVEAGRVDDPRFLYVCHSAEGQLDGLDLTVDADLEEAIRRANPSARGEHPFVDVAEVRRRYRELPPGQAKRYFLNIWGRGGDEQWLPEGRWEELAAPDRVVEPGTAMFLGFDGSDRNDSTALVGVTGDDVPHVVVLGVWERPEKAPEAWSVPRHEVLEAVESAFATYDVKRMTVDPFLWREEVAAWQAEWGEDRVVELKTNYVNLWGEACEVTFAAVVEGKVTHDANPVLDRHLRNAVPRAPSNQKHVTFGKIHAASPRKVDAAVALTLAMHAAHAWVPEPEHVAPFFLS